MDNNLGTSKTIFLDEFLVIPLPSSLSWSSFARLTSYNRHEVEGGIETGGLDQTPPANDYPLLNGWPTGQLDTSNGPSLETRGTKTGFKLLPFDNK